MIDYTPLGCCRDNCSDTLSQGPACSPLMGLCVEPESLPLCSHCHSALALLFVSCGPCGSSLSSRREFSYLAVLRGVSVGSADKVKGTVEF